MCQRFPTVSILSSNMHNVVMRNCDIRQTPDPNKPTIRCLSGYLPAPYYSPGIFYIDSECDHCAREASFSESDSDECEGYKQNNPWPEKITQRAVGSFD